MKEQEGKLERELHVKKSLQRKLDEDKVRVISL